MATSDEERVKTNDRISVNGKFVHFDDGTVQIREILEEVGLTPPSEYQVIMVEKGRTHLKMAEDKIVLADHPNAFLRAFFSGESNGFTVNEISQVWGDEEMEVDEFLAIWAPPEGYDWVLEKVDEPDVVLRPGSTLSFGPNGVEHIVSRPHHGDDKLVVTVVTLSGIFPSQGGLRVKRSELISDVLAKAARALHLTDTSGWVVSSAGNDINASLTFAQAGLCGNVELAWMPLEGGGGDA